MAVWDLKIDSAKSELVLVRVVHNVERLTWDVIVEQTEGD